MAGEIHFKGPEAQVPGQAGADKQAADSSATKGEGRFFRSDDKNQDTGPDYTYERMRFHKKDEVNPYAAEQDARHAMDPRLRVIIILAIILFVVFFLSATLPTQIFTPGQQGKGPAELFHEFGAAAQGFLAFLTGSVGMYSVYVWEIVAAMFAGAAMALSGGVYQGALKNALASPSTLGVTSGGSLGVIIYGVFFYKGNYSGLVSGYSDYVAQMGPLEYLIENFGTFICAFFGCLVIVMLIMLIALIAGRGKVTNVSLIIAGQVFAAVIGVVLTWVRYYLVQTSSDSLLVTLLSQAQTVSFSGTYTAMTVSVFAVPLIICFVVIFMMSSRLSLLAFDDDEARSMGISTRFTRNLTVGLCTVMTALVISFCGPIGFVGFMVPHIARKIVGPDFRYLLPTSALFGASLVVVVHYLTELGIPGIASGSTGTFTSIVGCIMFLIMALRQRGKTSGDWV